MDFEALFCDNKGRFFKKYNDYKKNISNSLSKSKIYSLLP